MHQKSLSRVEKIRTGSDSDQLKAHLKRSGFERGVLRELRFGLVAIAPSSDFAQPLLSIQLQLVLVRGDQSLFGRFVATINALGNRPQGLSNLDGVNVRAPEAEFKTEFLFGRNILEGVGLGL